MKKPDEIHALPASELITQKIADLGDWRGKTLARMRKLINEAAPDVLEEWKWGTPVWSHDGILCTGESYKDKVKLTLAKGASLKGRKLRAPPSRRLSAKPSPSTAPARKNLQGKRRPEDFGRPYVGPEVREPDMVTAVYLSLA